MGSRPSSRKELYKDGAGILCLAGAESTATVQRVAKGCGIPVTAVSTCTDAIAQLKSGLWLAVVAALGTKRGVDLLLDGGGESSLISAAKALRPAPLVAVFSWTACERKGIASKCRRAGADAVICSADGLIDLLVAPAPRVLCLAGEDTAASVREVAGKHDVSVVRVATNAEALEHISNKGPWGGVVAALGTRRGVDVIFDGADDRSSLISMARRLQPSPTVVVFSHTACKRSGMAQACMDAGADAVLCSADALDELLASVEASRASFLHDRSDAEGAVAHEPVVEMDAEDAVGRQFPIYRSTAEYPIVAFRNEHNEDLERSLGSDHRAVKKLKKLTKELAKMIDSLPEPLTISAPPPSSAPPPVRFVHVSDTHHHHRSVQLPPGEVLLHTGDLVGNYGDRDILKHLSDFVAWLAKISSRYKLIVVIAGNHDTLLDEEKYPKDAAKAKKPFFDSLPANVVYLENSGVDYEGLKLWGSPVLCCRQETLGKRYLSNAFERPRAERQHIWANIPEGVDVLMTHCPPHRILCASDCGCELLLARLNELRLPPRFHCFGHDHDFYGVKAGPRTTFVNGAIEEVRRMDRAGQVCGWVFDLPRGPRNQDVLMRSMSGTELT